MTVQHSNESVMYMAMELSSKKWKLRFGDGKKVYDKTLTARDLQGLQQTVEKARTRFHLAEDVRIVSCYEAGRDGFWIHRFLTKLGIENLVVDPASIEVNRRQRRAKTDRLDVEQLLTRLINYAAYDQKTVWKVCRVPGEEAEDERRMHRELARLRKERTSHVNRMRSLLTIHGIAIGNPATTDLAALRDWQGKPLPPAALAELQRQQQRLRQTEEHMQVIEKEKNARLASPQNEGDAIAAKLLRLRGMGPVGSWLLAKELFAWRKFQNRRQVGSAAGLTGTPYSSGDSSRDQGISKAGNRWVRKLCVEMAWNWIRFQPESALAKWFLERYSTAGSRMRRIGIVALARKLLVALWKYVERDELPQGALLKS
jgi:transposase